MRRIRTFENNPDITVIKLDVNNGVCTMDTWVCLDETGPVFSWQGQCVVRVSQKNFQDQGLSAAVRMKKVVRSKS